jgi:mono/diheme cytochrome c family protein
MNFNHRALLTLLFLAPAACGSAKPTATTHSATAQAHDEHSPHEHDEAQPVATVAATPDPQSSSAPVVDIKAQALQAELAAYQIAKPVFDANCSRCHTKGAAKATASKLKHFDMTAYPFGGHHAATIGDEVDETLGQSGKKATMPIDKKGSVQGDDLAKIIAWSAAWRAADKLGAH